MNLIIMGASQRCNNCSSNEKSVVDRISDRFKWRMDVREIVICKPSRAHIHTTHSYIHTLTQTENVNRRSEVVVGANIVGVVYAVKVGPAASLSDMAGFSDPSSSCIERQQQAAMMAS